MKILTKPIEKKLRQQYAATIDAEGASLGHKPILKLFGGSSFTYLASEIDEDGNIYGLADHGHGTPELGWSSLAEIMAIKFPPFGLQVERDRHFKATKTLSEYAADARKAGHIAA